MIQGENLSHHRSEGDGFSIPLGSATSGRLVFTSDAIGVNLRAEPSRQVLARGRFESHLSWVGFEEGIVMVGYRWSAPTSSLTGPTKPVDEITLNTAIPWEIEFRGDASWITARLGGLQLRSLDVLGGASQVVLELSKPAGTAYLYLTGGASQVTIRRPADVGVGINIQGGLTRLLLDGQWTHSLGSETRLESAGFKHANCRYELSLAGRASQITIGREIA